MPSAVQSILAIDNLPFVVFEPMAGQIAAPRAKKIEHMEKSAVNCGE
jgi:hypothetical protein